jgi:hypothetical protein
MSKGFFTFIIHLSTAFSLSKMLQLPHRERLMRWLPELN